MSRIRGHRDRQEELHAFLWEAGNEADLLRPDGVAERLRILDALDSVMGDAIGWTAGSAFGIEVHLAARLRKVRRQLEWANEEIFDELRGEIVREGHSRRLWQMLRGGEGGEEPQGLRFDVRDEIASGVLRLGEPGEPERERSCEMMAYQPTPVRHVLDLIATSRLAHEDVLVDLGSGLGHVPLLVSILAGIRTLGVELEPAYVACARECAASLGIGRARFIAEDARAADLASGTVYYLYTPFRGTILEEVLCRLRRESAKRQIRICSLGPCTRELEAEPWLELRAPAEAGRITLFVSR
ncbi:MAG TPA: hypothetical protein VHE33_11310 [Acidobacteriaceae bacterium]|nr:hypothetical protein [Acidobacteriaceae bacterium]